MLRLENIKKSYTTGEFTQVALNDVSLNFRKNEFVAILGQSGSGKTTFLNVIGGLDKYDSGDLIINGKSTKQFQSSEWDAYRNNSIGFIFQSYNLIGHLSIVDNVEIGMTLSGVSSSVKHKKAVEVLERVGLKDHLHKKPNQLSGGQMQRVAIARALANNPDIILADEPTGALDTQTSQQIMDLIKEIAKDKLVIMVTHNPNIAEKYADRIVRFSDGRVIEDSNPYSEITATSDYRLKKTSMSFLTALKLSGKNIKTKKWRTALTSFASSIGIIGIALILSLSNGFDQQINQYETETLANFPISVNQRAMSIDMVQRRSEKNKFESYPDTKKIYPYDPAENTVMHTNVITEAYIEYIGKIDKSLIDGISYTRSINMNLLKMNEGKAVPIFASEIGFTSFPGDTSPDVSGYLKQYYDLLYGEFPKDKTELILVLDEYNRVHTSLSKALGIDGDKEFDFDKVLGLEMKLILNNDYYKENGDYYTANAKKAGLNALYNSDNAVTLKIVGIIRAKENNSISTLSQGILYSDKLAEFFIEDAKRSGIVLAQQEADYNVMTGASFRDSKDIQSGGMGRSNQAQTKEQVLSALGASSIPSSVSVYPINFEAKEKITAYLDQWNEGLKDEERIEYTDMAEIVTTLSGSIMDAITIVLVAFAAISLVVSLIMISIITYISVLERTREIGVLRALGARKKDITRVFNAETFIIGSFSGLLGIGIAYLLTIPVNMVLYQLTELRNVAQLNPVHALVLIFISVVLTMLGGLIPSKMASKKDPVIALHSE
ncbi:MAG TPA: sulfate ABC transporter ATP-binding protein [Ruminococcaceae bacterium]|nr:sulfate ABC transporter ATP-binding protein [Oscillospiraceae bacterium]